VQSERGILPARRLTIDLRGPNRGVAAPGKNGRSRGGLRQSPLAVGRQQTFRIKTMQRFISKLDRGEHLTREETRQAFDHIMSGRAEESEIADFLKAMARKGEAVDELVGAAEVMRAKVTHVRCDDPNAVDTCGTGGDGISTFNVSTTAAVVAAAAGATVAKHGNRSVTRSSGSAEVLDALGVNVSAEVPIVERCLREARIGFLFAVRLHPAMKYAAPVRKTLGIRTIFNLLGPLTNPAGVRRQLLGVPRPELTETLARALARLGAVHAMVVHAQDGLCDLSITGPSRITEVRDGAIHSYTIEPETFGLRRASLDHLKVDSPAASAAAVRAVLEGDAGPRRDMVLLNAAAALVVANRASDLPAGIAQAAEAIDSRAAATTLAKWIELSRSA